ncbi:hypothetical protein Ccrd_010598 [Cynara cardunculus var. scolymus]|uniref:Concanavalin A-like lectin/glucanase, subgroup n=1 Tax=Cynara cardunculus var. scolymus TaxID=59895 RepID=A0A124SHY7_CYNCS|nr:hypothetical protein Ccrd_010598 [Cynara cardunculus var. scolymus]
MVDTSMGKDEACLYLKIGLLCTQSCPKNQPSMSDAMKIVLGKPEDSTMYRNTTSSHATMTFTSITER